MSDCHKSGELQAKDLPPLHEGMLDAAGLGALFGDLGALAEVMEVITKGGAVDRATPGRLTLATAEELLRTGAVRGVQVRYRYEDAEWWDTILALPQGFRVVRIQQEWAER
jgi:hypothetical protein